MENTQQPPLTSDTVIVHPEKKNSALPLLIGIVAVTAIFSGVVGYYLGSMQKVQPIVENIQPEQNMPASSSPQTDTIACTMEAKLCPDGSSVGRSGPNCEFAECPQNSSVSNTNKKVVDSRPIGSLPYDYVSNVTVSSEWVERGNKLMPGSLREFESTDKCADIYINDLGPLDQDLEPFTASRYLVHTVPIPQESLYKIQYKIGDYESITVGPMGGGEKNNTAIEYSGRAIGVNTTINIADGEVSDCVFPELSAKKLIESIRFQKK